MEIKILEKLDKQKYFKFWLPPFSVSRNHWAGIVLMCNPNYSSQLVRSLKQEHHKLKVSLDYKWSPYLKTKQKEVLKTP